MISKNVTSITQDGDAITINFDDGSSFGLANLDDVRALAMRLEKEDVWLMCWCGYWLSRDADLTSNAVPLGRFTLDAAAANFFRKQ